MSIDCLSRNYSLKRAYLDFGIYSDPVNGVDLEPLRFWKISGLARFWDGRDDFSMSSVMKSVLCGLADSGGTLNSFVYLIVGTESGISIYVGSNRPILDSSLRSAFPGIDISSETDEFLCGLPDDRGGIFTGIPGCTSENVSDDRIDEICQGMIGRRFCYAVYARTVPPRTIHETLKRIYKEMNEVYKLINQSITVGPLGNQVVQTQDYSCKNYFESLESIEKQFSVGAVCGMWRVAGYYGTDSDSDAERLKGIIRSGFSGTDPTQQPFRVLSNNGVGGLIENTQLISCAERVHIHPLSADGSGLFGDRYLTVLNSEQLGILCQLPDREFPGCYVDEHVEFDTDPRNTNKFSDPVEIGDICQAGRQDPLCVNKYLFEKNDFTRHALIIGITGGGKTNTSKSLLKTLWADERRNRIPFLVIESAKREYWELRNINGFEDLLVFTLGSESAETSVKYRINPFEAAKGISLQTHIDYLLSTFKAAFEMYPPMPYILETAVYEIYSDRGWDIAESNNIYGFSEYPTLSDLYNKIDIVVDRLGYHKEVQSNVKAALQARINSLMIGGKGAMLNTPKSVPIGELLDRPVVMELEDIGDDETKSFVIGILLVQLYEYRKSCMTAGSRELSHILLVEEAHRLLKNVSPSGESGSTRAKSVEFFCNLLAEIRTYGQGILIADQIPTKLAPDTIKNTNLKIVHRTVAKEDRETIGRAMNMSDEQIGYLSSLRRGCAAVYAEGDNRPKCVKMPLLKPEYSFSRSQVLFETREKLRALVGSYETKICHTMACTYCTKRCAYRKSSLEKMNMMSRFTNNAGMTGMQISDIWFRKKKHTAYSMNEFFKTLEMWGITFAGNEERLCFLGAYLAADTSLTDSRRQQIIADEIRRNNMP